MFANKYSEDYIAKNLNPHLLSLARICPHAVKSYHSGALVSGPLI